MFDGSPWFDPIETAVRERVRGFIEVMLGEELTAALGRGRYRRDGGPADGYRHGVRHRWLLGSFGPLEITVPRGRMPTSEGRSKEWRSAILPRYARITRQAEALIAATYLAGTNTRRVKRALGAHAPEALHEEITAGYHDMIFAETSAEVMRRRRLFLARWRLKCRAVADGLEAAGESLFTFTRLHPSQWK